MLIACGGLASRTNLLRLRRLLGPELSPAEAAVFVRVNFFLRPHLLGFEEFPPR